MIQSNYTVQVLEPNEGYVLTQSGEVELANRIFSEKIFLAVNDSPDNWMEITIDEANKLKMEIESLHNKDK